MTLTSLLYGAMLKDEPVVTRAVNVRRDVPVRAPDGTALLTHVYLASPGRPLPVILIRTPYGRSLAGTIARLFAERGYHAVIQSTRGTFGSGGRIDFDAEAADGRSVADWITEQPWSDGTIGTFGGSYLSLTQLALASTRPPQLKAMALSVWGADRREYKYPGGAFTLEQALSWVFTMEHQERPLGFLRTPLRARKALAPAFDQQDQSHYQHADAQRQQRQGESAGNAQAAQLDINIDRQRIGMVSHDDSGSKLAQ